MLADELCAETLQLEGGDIDLLRPCEAAELPDVGGVEWAPPVPYWSVLWRSGVALGDDVSTRKLKGLRVVELGCGLAVPSLAASLAGAAVLAIDESEEALELLFRNATRNGLPLETLCVDWAHPAELLARPRFDLALAADVLYQRESSARLLELLPRLAPRVLLAEPGRPAADHFLAEVRRSWSVTTRITGVVRIHTLERPTDPERFQDSRPEGASPDETGTDGCRATN